MSDGAVVTIRWTGPLGTQDIRYSVGETIFTSDATSGVVVAMEVSTGRDKRTVLPTNTEEKKKE
jgi:hypothetical protein